MECPVELKGDDRKLWKKLFEGLEPKNILEIEMAKRYINWFKQYENESKAVAEKGSVTQYNNAEGPSPHFKNMLSAEGEMRRLYAQLSKSIVKVKEKAKGEFDNL